MLGRCLSKSSPIPILAQKPCSLGSLWEYLCKSHRRSAAGTTTSLQALPRAVQSTRKLPAKPNAIFPSDDSAIYLHCTPHHSFALFISWWGQVSPLFDSPTPFYQADRTSKVLRRQAGGSS